MGDSSTFSHANLHISVRPVMVVSSSIEPVFVRDRTTSSKIGSHPNVASTMTTPANNAAAPYPHKYRICGTRKVGSNTMRMAMAAAMTGVRDSDAQATPTINGRQIKSQNQEIDRCTAPANSNSQGRRLCGQQHWDAPSLQSVELDSLAPTLP